MDIYSIRSIYVSSLPHNPEACVPQLILPYSKFSSYLSNLSIYSLLILPSKRKPATEESLYLFIISGFLVVQCGNVQLLRCVLFLVYHFLIILLERQYKRYFLIFSLWSPIVFSASTPVQQGGFWKSGFPKCLSPLSSLSVINSDWKL